MWLYLLFGYLYKMDKGILNIRGRADIGIVNMTESRVQAFVLIGRMGQTRMTFNKLKHKSTAYVPCLRQPVSYCRARLMAVHMKKTKGYYYPPAQFESRVTRGCQISKACGHRCVVFRSFDKLEPRIRQKCPRSNITRPWVNVTGFS